MAQTLDEVKTDLYRHFTEAPRRVGAIYGAETTAELVKAAAQAAQAIVVEREQRKAKPLALPLPPKFA